MRIIVFQHADAEHPGIFRDFFRDDGHAWETVQLYNGQKIVELQPYDFLLVMGGPQDVWQEKEYPWLREEKEAIRKFVLELKRPFLGICLGHQLLADALGGRVEPAALPEIGVLPITKTEAGRVDSVMSGISDPFMALQWHSAEVTALPKDAIRLASSVNCKNQAFRFSDHAYGLQGHVEATSETVPNWAKIPEYANSGDPAYGREAIAQLARNLDDNLPAISVTAHHLYARIRATITSD